MLRELERVHNNVEAGGWARQRRRGDIRVEFNLCFKAASGMQTRGHRDDLPDEGGCEARTERERKDMMNLRH